MRKENAKRFVLNLRLVVSLVSSVDPIRQHEMVIERVMLFTSWFLNCRGETFVFPFASNRLDSRIVHDLCELKCLLRAVMITTWA